MTDLPLDRPDRAPDADPPLDRTISPIAGRLAAGGRGKALAFAGLLAGCGAIALATWSAEQPRPAKPRETPARQVVAFEPATGAPTLAQPGAGAPRLSGADGPDVPAIEADGRDAQTGGRPAALSPVDVARRAPLMAYSRSGGAGALLPLPPLAAATAVAQRAPTQLELLQQGSSIDRATAGQVGNRNFLILAGATIPCVLQTALDTTTAGYVTCVIDRDVYSDNGAVVLLEKGARVLGEYRTGMQQGQDRIFVLWTRAVSPAGVAIGLGSPATDALGRAGFGGAVDTHFWDRFGAAVLLSIVGDATAALDRDSRSSAVRLPSDAAGLAVQQGGDIRPTLRKAQGSEVAIQVARDLDFSTVYGLKARP